MLLTIVELPEYRKHAEKLFLETERADLIAHLAEHPKAGDVMQGTGGVRKLRWARQGMGKSGGSRVIYYYHNERANLSKAERNELAKLVEILADYAHGE